MIDAGPFAALNPEAAFRYDRMTSCFREIRTGTRLRRYCQGESASYFYAWEEQS